MADAEIIKLIPKSYLAAIRNSVGANTWRNFYALDHGVERDVLNGGDLSGAYFVSSITTMFGLSKSIHMTVDNVIKDLEENGWAEIKQPKRGAVLLWEAQDFGEFGAFTQLGFYMGDDKAVSASLRLSQPAEHDWLCRDFPPKGKNQRKVEKMFWHEKLNS